MKTEVKTVDDVDDAYELIEALGQLQKHADDEHEKHNQVGVAVVNIFDPQGFPLEKVRLERETLTDGSFVFNIVLDFENPAYELSRSAFTFD
jgi:hypothetical protein